MPNDNFNLDGVAKDVVKGGASILGAFPDSGPSVWDMIYQATQVPSVVAQAAGGGFSSACDAYFGGGGLAGESSDLGHSCENDIISQMWQLRAP